MRLQSVQGSRPKRKPSQHKSVLGPGYIVIKMRERDIQEMKKMAAALDCEFRTFCYQAMQSHHWKSMEAAGLTREDLDDPAKVARCQTLSKLWRHTAGPGKIGKAGVQ